VDRVTFSPTLINHARSVVFLVAGADKAAVLAEVLEGPLEPDRLPAQLIRPEGVTHWLVDREAAGLLRAKGDSQ
jgi:6-phosphogluconolactonase